MARGMTPAEVVQRFGQAWAAHDLETALDLLADDCIFDATGPAPDGTVHTGRDAIRKAWQPIFDDSSSHFDTEDTIDAGEHLIQRWRYRWDGGHVRGIDVFRVSNGLIAEKLSYVKG